MIALYIILTIAVLYAAIRAKHDSYLSHGEWKRWAFIEGCLIALSSTFLVAGIFTLQWWLVPVLALIFAFSFWIVFDCIQGYIRTKNILHIGTVGFDGLMRQVFRYRKGYAYLFFKLWWLFLLIAAYHSLINTY